jgi:CubicO group peptidase (beta-lactamase class C family)
MRKNIYLLIIFIITTASLSAQNKQELLLLWKNVDSIKVEFKKHQPKNGFGMVLVYDGKVIKKAFAGYADRKSKTKYSDKTIHLWGSVSKLFTAVAIIQLVEKGKLKLSSPITQFVPSLKKNPPSKHGNFEQVTIQHILNHNSGLRLSKTYNKMWDDSPEIKKRCPTIEEIRPYFKYATLVRKPGSEYEYSNSGFSLLGLVIEKVTGLKFEKYIDQNIFKPLRMKTAHYGKTPRKWQKYLATSYYAEKNGELKVTHFDMSQGFQEPNGGVKATIGDMVKFMNFLKFHDLSKRHSKVLAKSSIQKYFFTYDKNDVNNHSVQFTNKFSSNYYLSGFDYYHWKTKDITYIGHTGNVENYRSYFQFRKNKPYGVILMHNTSGHHSQDEMISEGLLRIGKNAVIMTYKGKKVRINWEYMKKYLRED